MIGVCSHDVSADWTLRCVRGGYLTATDTEEDQLLEGFGYIWAGLPVRGFQVLTENRFVLYVGPLWSSHDYVLQVKYAPLAIF